MRLKIGGVPEHFNLPWRLAMEEGELINDDIHLHWEDMTGGTGQMVRGLQNKTLDVAVLLTEGITKAILQGLDAKILQVYVASPLHWGIHVPYHDGSIQQVGDIEGKTFAISRKGSGSELMAYVLADREGWDINQLKFKSVGDVYGGLWALQNDAAQAFLWETYTTKPHVDKKDCRFIGEVITPWPSFVVAVRTEIADKFSDKLNTMLSIVNKKADKLKHSEESIGVLAWRYGLQEEDVKKWITRTEWNYEGKGFEEEFETVVDYLLKLNLVSQEEAANFENKLFYRQLND